MLPTKLQVIGTCSLFAFILTYSNLKTVTGQVDASFHRQPTLVLVDTTKKIEVDDYPVTNEMFGADVKQNGREIKSGEVYSGDKVWFTNQSLNQTLVFELYTDDFRNAIFHFLNNDVPKDLIKEMELSNAERFPAAENLKVKYFKGFIKKALPIKAWYFKTKKGFALGDPKDNVIKKYGKPDKVSITDGIERCEWDFEGDDENDTKTSSNGKPLARGSYGYQVIMFFRNNKIIGIILHNDIP